MIRYILIFTAFVLLYFTVDYADLSGKSKKLFKLLKQIIRLLFNAGLNSSQQEKIAAKYSLKIFFYSLFLGLTILLTIAGFVLLILGLSYLFFKDDSLYQVLISMKGFVISLLAFALYLLLKKLR
jgi:hypothetical protein